MKTLFLHVGHAKTGSSYLQSLFARNSDFLESCRIKYPFDESIREARLGKITTGNGKLLVEKMLENRGSDGDWSELYSSEILFPYFTESGFTPYYDFWLEERKALDPEVRFEKLLQWAEEWGFERVEVLLFIRNPISHALSQFHQRVKRGGCTQGVSEVFASFEVPRLVAEFLDVARRFEIVRVSVRNYSVVANELDLVVSRWLKVSEFPFVDRDETVNRSMSVSEVEFLRCLNRTSKRSGLTLSDRLCHLIPNINPPKAYPASEVQAELWRRNLPEIEKVNSWISREDYYQFDRKEPNDDISEFTFSAAQIGVIADCLGERISELESGEKNRIDAEEILKDKLREVERRAEMYNEQKKRLEVLQKNAGFPRIRAIKESILKFFSL